MHFLVQNEPIIRFFLLTLHRFFKITIWEQRATYCKRLLPAVFPNSRFHRLQKGDAGFLRTEQSVRVQANLHLPVRVRRQRVFLKNHPHEQFLYS